MKKKRFIPIIVCVISIVLSGCFKDYSDLGENMKICMNPNEDQIDLLTSLSSSSGIYFRGRYEEISRGPSGDRDDLKLELCRDLFKKFKTMENLVLKGGRTREPINIDTNEIQK